MYPAERRQEILRLVQEDGWVSVSELASHFGVSKAAIRRDLNELDRAGLLQRTYGGAVNCSAPSSEAPFSVRKVTHREEKARIGRAAAQLVCPGDILFVDGGTTTECMLPHLANKTEITVVTYGLNIAIRLAGYEHIQVILLGGTLHHRSLTIGGIQAYESLRSHRMRFHRAFLAASGVSAEGGVTNASFEEIPMKRGAIETAGETILLADSSKVGVIAPWLIVSADRIHRLITDAGASEAEVERLRRMGVAVDLV